MFGRPSMRIFCVRQISVRIYFLACYLNRVREFRVGGMLNLLKTKHRLL